MTFFKYRPLKDWLHRILPARVEATGQELASRHLNMSVLAKELRHPINILYSNLDDLLRDTEEARRTRSTQAIRTALLALSATVDSIKDLSESQSFLIPGDFSPQTLMEDLEERNFKAAAVQRLEYTNIVNPGTAILVHGPVNALQKSLQYILQAIVWNRHDGSLTVALDGIEREGQSAITVEITVKAAEGESANLSLATWFANELLMSVGGSARYDRHNGRGETFKILLPCQNAPTRRLKAQGKTLEGKSVLSFADPGTSHILRTHFKTWGMSLIATDSTPRFFAKLVEHASEKQTYDLVLIDLNALVGVSPQGFIDMVSSEYKLKEIRYVAMFEATPELNKHNLLRAGFTGFLLKPFDKPTLYRTLHVAFNRKARRQAASPVSPMARAGRRSDLAVLVVEDAPISKNLVSAWLSQSGMNVRSADSGQAALDIIKQYSFDLLIVDQHLPDADGLELVTKLTKSNGKPTTHCVVLSANESEDLVLACKTRGVDQLLVKPITMEGLLETINDIFEKGRGMLDPSLQQELPIININKLQETLFQTEGLPAIEQKVQRFKENASMLLDCIRKALGLNHYHMVYNSLQVLLGFSEEFQAERLTAYVNNLIQAPESYLEKSEFADKTAELSELINKTLDALTRITKSL